jgi:hypothetical protein
MASDTQRQDQANVHLAVDGKDCSFLFQKRSGGKTSAEGSKSFPGAMKPQKAHGGPPTVEDVTLEFEFVPNRDDDEIQRLKGRVGKGDCAASEDLLDDDGNVLRSGINHWTGVFQEIDTGDYDASSSDTRVGTVMIETDGVA